MKQFLDSIRKEESNNTLKRKIINTLFIFIFGILLGLFSKWLDNIALDNNIWWHNIIEKLDLGNFFSEMAIWLFIALTISIYSTSPKRASINVFIFFVGMNISYHLYTIFFSGFNPRSYMIVWYTLTLISPFLAYICWYSKSKNKISIIINSIIIFIMLSFCFSIGMWYFDLRGILYTLTFIATILTTYNDLKITSISFIIGLVMSFIIRISN